MKLRDVPTQELLRELALRTWPDPPPLDAEPERPAPPPDEPEQLFPFIYCPEGPPRRR